MNEKTTTEQDSTNQGTTQTTEGTPAREETPAAEQGGSDENANQFETLSQEMESDDFDESAESSQVAEGDQAGAETPASTPSAEGAEEEGGEGKETPSEKKDEATPAEESAKPGGEEGTKEKTKEQEEAERKKAEAEKETPTEVTSQEDDERTKQFLSLLRENRDKTVDFLAKSHFALSDEQARELDENPREAVPRIVAGLYLDAVQGAVSSMMSQMPTIVQSIVENNSEAQKAEEAFYTAWPTLREKPEYQEHVQKVAALHRKLNPKATLEEMIRDVGVQASLAFKLPLPEGTDTSNVSTMPAHRPAASVNQAASQGAGDRTPKNQYEKLAEEIIEEENASS